MREITTHKVNGCNEAIAVSAVGEPGPGGACHEYVMEFQRDGYTRDRWAILFQNGPVNPEGHVNGITNEALLAILIDRLQSFQNGEPGQLQLTAKGPFACRENAIALTHLEEAMMWLQKRTLARVARGVEGTLQK